MAVAELPDWVLGVNIEMQTIAAIRVDIVAMTVGTIAVDIVAQTVGNITIDIAAQSFANLTVDIAAQSLGNIAIDIAAQSFANLTIDIAAQTLPTLAVDITAQTLGTVAIDITAQTLGTVNIDVTSQTVDLNIRTAGGVNIVIDQLTQAAFVERRATISHHGGGVTWHSVTVAAREGKFFPRGVRGFLDDVGVYCRDAAAAGGTITVYLAPYIGAGYLYTADVTVPPAGGEAWRYASFNVMWEYDSMFIWVVCSNLNTQFIFDIGADSDGFYSIDSGVTWAYRNRRYWFTAVMQGLTVGDIPVSGTINTIEVPSIGGFSESAAPVNCPNAVITDLVTMQGMGTMLMAHVAGFPAVNPSHWDRYYQMTVETEAGRAITLNHMEITQSPDSPSGRSSCGELVKYSVAGVDYMQMNIRLPIKFRRFLRLRFRQQTGAAMTCTGTLYANLQR